MEKLNRAQKCSILGPQNLGSGGVRGGPGPQGPPGSAPGLCTASDDRNIQQLMKAALIHNRNLSPNQTIHHIFFFFFFAIPLSGEIPLTFF